MSNREKFGGKRGDAIDMLLELKNRNQEKEFASKFILKWDSPPAYTATNQCCLLSTNTCDIAVIIQMKTKKIFCIKTWQDNLFAIRLCFCTFCTKFFHQFFYYP